MAWLRKSPAERDARAQLRDATRRFKAAQSQQEADHAGTDMDRADDSLRAAQGKPLLPGRDEAYEEQHRADAEDEQAAIDARLEANAEEIDAYSRGQQSARHGLPARTVKSSSPAWPPSSPQPHRTRMTSARRRSSRPASTRSGPAESAGTTVTAR